MARHKFFKALAAAALVAAVAAPAASADTIRIESTTDTVDAGLVDGLLKPLYRAAYPGDELAYHGVGTGVALDNARAGQADVVITHARSLEEKFIADGFSLEPAGGRAIFYSDYVVVGPDSDPANVATTAPHDAVAAYEAIAAAGEAGRATFVTRGDNSGTNVQEQIIWGLTDVTKQTASNASGDAARFEPATPARDGSYPIWYRKTSTRGQGEALRAAFDCPPASFPNGACYIMVDRGTFNNFRDRLVIPGFRIVSQNNAEGTRGGKDLLINPFSVYIVNPEKVADRYAVNVAAARRFVDFLVSPAFQAAVDTFPSAVDPAFRSDAFASVTPVTALPQAATVGAAVPVTLQLANKVPGSLPITGMSVQLQQSTDNGASWNDAGAPQPTDAGGRVSFSPTVSATTRFRISMPLFRATTWNQLSPNVQELGTVAAVAAPPAPTPIGPAARRDTLAPRASRPSLTARGLSLRVSEATSVRATVLKRTVRRVRRGRRVRTVVRWVAVRSASGRAARAGVVRLSWRRALTPGAYRVRVVLRDSAGNARTQTLGVRVAARRSSRSRRARRAAHR